MIEVASLEIPKILYHPCCTASKVGHRYFSTKVGHPDIQHIQSGTQGFLTGRAQLFSRYLKVQQRFPSSCGGFEVNGVFALKTTISGNLSEFF